MTRKAEAPPSIDAIRILSAITGYWVSQAIYVAAKLGIADRLEGGPQPVGALAAAAGVDPDALFRLLRALASEGFFIETEPQHFGLTPAAEYLRAGHPSSLRAVTLLCGDLQYGAWGDLLYSITTAKCAYEHQSGRAFFTMLEDDAAAAATFNAAMTSFLQSIPALVVGSYDFSRYQNVVDVGGGAGALITAILSANPHLRGVLCDLPHVIAGARAAFAGPLGERCTLVGQDFFEGIPSGGDLYLLSTIIHDWDDERSVQILKNCRKAMGAEGRLVLVEMVIQPGNAPFFGKWLDLHMMVMHGGRDRTQAEYQRLLAAAGFALERVIPTSFLRSLIEARPI